MASSLRLQQERTWRKNFLWISSTISILVILITFLSREGFAHHAKEYIIIESYETTHEKEVGVINQFDYFKPDLDHPSEDN